MLVVHPRDIFREEIRTAKREITINNEHKQYERDNEKRRKRKITNNNENRSLLRQDSKSRWENGWMFPRRWMLPGLKQDMKDLDIFKSKGN